MGFCGENAPLSERNQAREVPSDRIPVE